MFSALSHNNELNIESIFFTSSFKLEGYLDKDMQKLQEQMQEKCSLKKLHPFINYIFRKTSWAASF